MMTPSRIDALLASLSPQEIEALKYDWTIWANAKQLPPKGDWTTWLLLGGRGAGKTRAGSEWVRSLATGKGTVNAVSPIALIGETLGDARNIMVEGISGLLSIHPKGQRPTFHKTRNLLEWPNGAQGQLFSAREPESLRGPQFAAAWCDEFAKWHYQQQAWDMLQFGLRLGARPRQLVTTTPKPSKLLAAIMGNDDTRTTIIKTIENKKNLAPSFFDKVIKTYQGTSLGRQELDGEILSQSDGALWRRDQLDGLRVTKAPALDRIIIAVDPPVSAHARSDKCGIVVVGKSGEQIFVLADLTMARVSPLMWASRVVDAFTQFNADCVVAEVNQGGDLVTSALHQISPNLPVRTVHAKRGKWLRAEPVALYYERGLVRHVGIHTELEDEMCTFTANGKADGHSPDRLDALVWAITELVQFEKVRPRIRNS
jgi:phage terminase large subunit-like protein